VHLPIAEQVGRSFLSRWMAASQPVARPTMAAGAMTPAVSSTVFPLTDGRYAPAPTPPSLIFFPFSPSISNADDAGQASRSPGIDCHSFLHPLVSFRLRADHSDSSSRYPLLDLAAHVPAWQQPWPPSPQLTSSPSTPIRRAAPPIPFGRSRLAHVPMTPPFVRVRQTSHVQETSPMSWPPPLRATNRLPPGVRNAPT